MGGGEGVCVCVGGGPLRCAYSALWCRPMVPYGVCPWCPMVSAHGALTLTHTMGHYGPTAWATMGRQPGPLWADSLGHYGFGPYVPYGAGPK